MEPRNSSYTKLHNRRRILRLIRQGFVSRAELSRQLGLTRAAISLIVDELMEQGIVRETEVSQTASGPGRHPVMLSLCPGACYAAGVGLSRSGCEVGIQDLTGPVLAWQSLELEPRADRTHWLKQIAQCIQAQLQNTGIDPGKLLGVGVVAPGPVDSLEGKILTPPDFPGWENTPVVQELESVLGLPVYLENDANACALYNYMENDFPQKDNFTLLYVDYGVGSGVISGGRLLRAAGGASCELGHTTIDFQGPVCSCGNRGCLELYASADRLAARYGEKDWEALMESPHRAAALDRQAQYLAAGIVNLANTVSTDAVLLGGRIQAQEAQLLPRLKALVQGRTLRKTPIAFLPSLYDRENKVKSACSVVFGSFLAVL